MATPRTTQAPVVTHTGEGQKIKLSDMKPKEQISYLLTQKKAEIAKMLPKHLNPERLLKVAQIAATTTPGLARCDVASLVGSIGQCAQLGLEPNTPLGHCYLVPFNTKRKDAQGKERWVNSVQVIVGYKGLIDLARRSGQIISIAAHEVCENDTFELVYGLDEKLAHTPAMGERGQVIGFYAIARLKDGGHAFEFMSTHQVEKIRDASQGWQQAQKYNKTDSTPWGAHFIEMGRKTAIRRLAKFLPLSIEFQTASALDEMAESGRDQNLENALDGDYAILGDDAPMVESHFEDNQIPINNENLQPASSEVIQDANPEATHQINIDAETGEMLDAQTDQGAPAENPNLSIEYEFLRNDLTECNTMGEIAKLLNNMDPALKADKAAIYMIAARQREIHAGK